MIRFHPLLTLLLTILTLAPAAALGRHEGALRGSVGPASGVQTLVVRTDRQAVVITEGGPAVTGRLIGTDDDVLTVTKEGSTLTVRVRTESGFFRASHRDARLELAVPPGLHLDLQSISGSIQVGVSAESLKARNASGNLEAPRGGGSADVDVASGSVTLGPFTGAVRALVLSGNLQLTGLTGAVRASTLSGNLTGSDLDPADGSRFSTVSGNLTLVVLHPDRFTWNAKTVSGSVTVPDNRGDRTLTLSTVSGSVEVR